ncbi:unnamed protein product [Acanthocheilonema viteae]|uniref:Uncharacterized protein n=1 Tax=Acanthocheilonema viteae TaxID=6277 RepID=A0A498SJ38_ACAVI|nr:unnamed protein product [Acanthocheilonema viteae]VBB33925.1 unnamed protein product [Acanthocheilonema viteae]VBB34689.1 unnamed protein product [Acanthocheilonema viteae]
MLGKEKAAKIITQHPNQYDAANVIDTALRDDPNESPFDVISRISKVNLVALETFGELNQFWGNANRILLPLAGQIERASLSLLRATFPQIFGDLNPSDIATDKVTYPPDKSNFVIKELIKALVSSAKRNSASSNSSN